MIKRELGQVEETLILENVIRWSNQENKGVRVVTKNASFFGILKSVDNRFLYLRGWEVGDLATRADGTEEHHLLAINAIEGISFITEKGCLDNLVE